MTHIFPIIEIHFYSSGLKAIHIGPQARPEWLPSFEIVGPRDIQLDNDDYVIELSRHERDNKLITWIGVWSKGVDLTAGDRGANYIGLGVWLIDALPTESYMIVSSLVKICDLLVKEGSPTEKVITTCSKLLNDPSYMQNWIKNIHELPLVDKGLVFQKDVYLQPIYIKSKDCDLQKAIISTSESILINCVNAVGDFKGKSQILYLILNSGSKADSNKPIKELINNPNLWLDYISILEQSNKDKNADLEHDVDKLKIENQNKAHQIKINDENINDLNVRNQELTEELNKKTESEHLCDLEAYILNLIKQIEQQSEVLESKNNQGIRQPINTSINSNDEALKQIKALHSLIANQTSTLSLLVKTNGPVNSYPHKPKGGQNPINEGFFSRYSFLIFIGIVLALIAVIGYGVYSVVFSDEIKVIDVIQEQPQSRNINIDDIKELNSKLDKISLTVGSIDNKIESSILAKETKIISPISIEQAPSNSVKNGINKVSKSNKKGK